MRHSRQRHTEAVGLPVKRYCVVSDGQVFDHSGHAGKSVRSIFHESMQVVSEQICTRVRNTQQIIRLDGLGNHPLVTAERSRMCGFAVTILVQQLAAERALMTIRFFVEHPIDQGRGMRHDEFSNEATGVGQPGRVLLSRRGE